MDGLTSLVGLTGYTIANNEETPEQRSGNAADPRHANVGEAAQPYSWESLQTPGAKAPIYGPADQGFIEDDFFYSLTASQVDELPAGDTEPWTHAGPWPSDPIGDGSVGPDNAIRQLEQNTALRSLPVGRETRAIFRPWANPQQDNWNEIWEVDPNSDDIPVATNQMKASLAPGGRGGTDRRQSFAKQNEYGFDSRHMHRRFAYSRIPGNYMYLAPAGRPLVKSIAGPARPPVGENSQFAGQDLGEAFDTQGAILENSANAYAGPPTPYVAPKAETPVNNEYDYTDYYGM